MNGQRLFLVFALSALAAVGQSAFRLTAVDASELPRVFAFVDRQANAKPLEAGEFFLLTDGKMGPAAIATPTFRETGAGVALIVALDASGSMRGRPLEAIRQGLARLVSRKRKEDRVAVLSFANDMRWETRWKADADTVQSSFRNLTSRGTQTHLYDAVAAALDELQTAEDLPVRHAVLLISDGHDEGSTARLRDISRRVSESRVRLDTAGVANSPGWFTVLRQLATAGRGEFHEAAGPDALGNIIEQGIDRLLDAPVLEFKAEDIAQDGKEHRIGVTHKATSWRDDLPVKLAKGFWRQPAVWAGAIALLLATAFAGYMIIGRSGTTSQPARPTVPVANKATPPSEPARRILEPRERPQPAASPQAPPLSAPTATAAAPPPPWAPPLTATPRQPTEFTSSREVVPGLLRVTGGPYTGQHVALTEPEFWIGSESNNHFCLSADAGVSGNHACIRREGNILRLYDNGSLNDTWVNGRRVGSEAVMLRAGDQLRIGASELKVEP